MDELCEITDYIQEASGYTAELITGYGIDQSLGDNVGVTIIATGFESNKPNGFETIKQPEKIVNILEEHKTEVVEVPVNVIVQTNIEEIIKEEEKKEDEPFLVIKNTEEVMTETTFVNMQEAESPTPTQKSEIEFIVTNESSSNEIVNEENTYVINDVTEVNESL